MRRVFGVVALLVGAATTTALGMFASRLAGAPATKVRAIVVHGTLVTAPVVITDAKITSALHDEVGAQKYAPPYPRELLTRRPCLVMAAFLPKSGRDATSAAGLRPEQADVSWFYYPAVDHEPAVLGRSRMSHAHLDALAGYGIPAKVSRAAGAPCSQLATVSSEMSRR